MYALQQKSDSRAVAREMAKRFWKHVAAELQTSEAAEQWFAKASTQSSAVKFACEHLVADVVDRAFAETIAREAFIAGWKHAKSKTN